MITEANDLAVGFMLGVATTWALSALVLLAVVRSTRRNLDPRQPTEWDRIAAQLRREGDGIDWTAEAMDDNPNRSMAE